MYAAGSTSTRRQSATKEVDWRKPAEEPRSSAVIPVDGTKMTCDALLKPFAT